MDAVVAQGAEAGAHRGTFLDSFESSMIPTLELVRIVVDAIRLPVIATGGIMDGRDIVSALKAGASALQLGTAFLPCPESSASKVYKRAILAAKQDTTVVTRAFSGRPARRLKNAFITSLDDKQSHILGYPLQNALTRSMRTARCAAGHPGLFVALGRTGRGPRPRDAGRRSCGSPGGRDGRLVGYLK